MPPNFLNSDEIEDENDRSTQVPIYDDCKHNDIPMSHFKQIQPGSALANETVYEDKRARRTEINSFNRLKAAKSITNNKDVIYDNSAYEVIAADYSYSDIELNDDQDSMGCYNEILSSNGTGTNTTLENQSNSMLAGNNTGDSTQHLDEEEKTYNTIIYANNVFIDKTARR